MADITISSGEFKALSSDARVKILKLLKERRHTLSEISAKIGIAAPSAKQHLQMLLDKGFVERFDEGRKWKYYALTGKGMGIADAEQNRANILIVLGATLVALVGIMAIMFSNIGVPWAEPTQAPLLGGDTVTGPALAVPAAAEKNAGIVGEGEAATARRFTEEDCTAAGGAPEGADGNFSAEDLNALAEYCENLVPD